MATMDDVKQALLDEIAKSVPGETPKGLLALAEAYAWVVYPNEAHGQSSSGGS
jgi:hypothetical protein